MKKIICLLLSITLTFGGIIALADSIDLSGMSFDELLALQGKVNSALWSNEDWKEVKVPVGVYKVGEDIPEGRWTVKRSVDKYTYFRVGQRFTNGEVGRYVFTTDLETEANLILEAGTYIEISYYPVIFTPYVASFKFE